MENPNVSPVQPTALDRRGGSTAISNLRMVMECESDIKRVVRLVPDGQRFRYQIETPFATWPKFVIGTTDAEFQDVRIEHRCGLIESSDEHWAGLSNTEVRHARADATAAPSVEGPHKSRPGPER